MPKVCLVAAIDDKRGLAKNGKLPWNLPTDRKYFQDKIKDGPVVSGWNTYKSNGLRPYGNGKNYVITRSKNASNVEIIRDAEEFFKNLKEDIWVAGGGEIFKHALPYATELYLTRIPGDYECDVFFPPFEDDFELANEDEPITENGITFVYQLWVPKTLA